MHRICRRYRHDFEEFHHILEGEVEFTFRDANTTEQTGRTVAFPANAPHAFKNPSKAPARMPGMCALAGQEEFFLRIGDQVNTRPATAPKPDKKTLAAQKKKSGNLLRYIVTGY